MLADVSTASPLPPPSAAAGEAPALNLALQGGGSYGAFTWGVLDALLQDGRLRLEAISGTSAGAMNAVVLAHGLAQPGAPRQRLERARTALADFWQGVVALGLLGQAQRAPLDAWLGGAGGAGLLPMGWAGAWARAWVESLSPYQANPLGINPLRTLLLQHVDFERLQQVDRPRIHVVATAVRTGQARVFCGRELTVDAVLASACVPVLFQAVEIDGEPYWDGAYSGNPYLRPLLDHSRSAHILMVQINPQQRSQLPTATADILERINEITFNANLRSELRAIDVVNRLLAQGQADPRRYRPIHLHRIEADEALAQLSPSTKTSTDAELIHTLRDLGRARAQGWLQSPDAAPLLAAASAP